MQFVCGRCKAKYTITADRVQGRVLKIRCRECGDIIEIRGDGLAAGTLLEPGRRKAGSSSKDLTESYKISSLKDKFKESFTAKGAGQLPLHDPLEQPTSPVDFPREGVKEIKDPKRWYVAVHNQPVGPVSKTKVRSYLKHKEIDPGALVWRDGFDDWKPLGACAELADLLEEVDARPGPAPAPSPPPAPRPAAEADRTEMDAMRGFHIGRIDAPQNAAQAAAVGDILVHDVFRPVFAPVEKPPTLLARVFKSRIALVAIGAIALLIPFGITMLILGVGQREEGVSPDKAPVVAEEAPKDGEHSERGNILAGLTITLEEVIEQELAAEKMKTTDVKIDGGPSKGKVKKGGKDDEGSSSQLPAGVVEKSVATSTNVAKVAGGGTKGQNGLTDQQLYKVVKENSKSIQKCYEKVLGKGMGTDEDIKVKMRVNVGSSGMVTKASVIEITSFGNFLTPCIESGIKGWIFPRADSPSEFIFPVLLTPKH